MKVMVMSFGETKNDILKTQKRMVTVTETGGEGTDPTLKAAAEVKSFLIYRKKKKIWLEFDKKIIVKKNQPVVELNRMLGTRFLRETESLCLARKSLDSWETAKRDLRRRA